jgi:hypothetical protein
MGITDCMAELDTKANLIETNQVLATKADLQAMVEALDQKASKQSTAAALHKKAAKEEVRQWLDTKADAAEVRDVLSQKADVGVVATQLKQKADQADVIGLVESKAREIMHETSSADAQMHALLCTKVDRAEFVEGMQTKAGLQETRLGLSQKINASEALDTINTRFNQVSLESKAFAQESTQNSGALRSELHTTAADLQSAMNKKADLFEMNNQLALKASLDDVRVWLERKADVQDVNEALSHKCNISDVNAALDKKGNVADLQELAEIVSGKADIGAMEDANMQLARIKDELSRKADDVPVSEQLGALQKEVMLKCNINDACALLDTKANVEDVNRAMDQINGVMDSKAVAHDLNQYIREQSIINESLCAEHSCARFIWKSGKTRTGHGVPWNVQSVNTNPQNFLWEKDKVNLVTVAPGLYEITFGFFCKKKPSVQLLINGEPVLSAINSASYVVHHSSGRLASVGKHPAGNVTGLTCIDFLALPPQARIAITYNGEEGAEGFVGLRKL